VVVAAIRHIPSRVSIRGHADALQFAPGAAYDNWALSSDRANATRRMMVELGLAPARIAEVVGKGDAEPLLPDRADDPRNRRISIVLLRDGAGS
jgi:chemotaxis protein MotB